MTEKVAKLFGEGERRVRKRLDMVEAAEAEPEKFGHLVEEMDRTGKVNGACRKVRMANDEKRVFSLVP